MQQDQTKTVKSEGGLQLLDKVRTYCIGLPEVAEQVDSFGHTSFRVNDKPFVMLGEHGEDGSLAIKTSPATQEILLQQDQTEYFKTPYIGQHGWVSIRFANRADWQEIEELIQEAYLRTAPKRLIRLLDR
ncbi:MmcQ/YjbR family DNA-binding protein [Paenibacillus ehimensis]|uniref:MmcQ/YjbR family DNA-binding protein n=1 Tax=Paenibacillus ehimensis TaxID=79264 RepID=UPI000FDA3437|nr:MmcQ/YjbR family DNA-binding protein [Paenibacillus ehimensis]MEC0208434.1 MmcQ/YjbR family DNA-binding protein [Paenibacillus ehimensis]